MRFSLSALALPLALDLALLHGVAACGASAAPSPAAAQAPVVAPATSTAESPSPAPPLDAVPLAVPTACADPAAPLCTPPAAFAERLCTKPRQDIALALFGKSTPFSRLYLRGAFDELLFGEEVLVLRFHAVPKNGIQVGSASGSYDVLRWDGSCSNAVDADIVSRSAPAKPKHARLPWHRIGDKTQDALIASSDAVKRAHAKRGRECRGAMSGDVSTACEKADAALGDAIVDYVREGGALPAPDAP